MRNEKINRTLRPRNLPGFDCAKRQLLHLSIEQYCLEVLCVPCVFVVRTKRLMPA